MTASDLISASLRLIGVLASGEPLGANEATDGLNSLNDMIDSWSNENLFIPNKVREVFPLVANQQTYTMGSGGNFSTSRPIRIENALIQLVATSPVIEIPMNVLTKDQYAAVLLKTMTSNFPLYVYADGAYPLNSLSMWPVPTDVDNIVLYSSKPLTTLTNINTAISLPPGYQRALKYALAIELAPEYGRSVPPEVAAIASESRAAIKTTNFKPDYLQVDDALRPRPAVWNWRTGDTN